MVNKKKKEKCEECSKEATSWILGKRYCTECYLRITKRKSNRVYNYSLENIE